MTVTDWPTASLTAFRLCSALHSLDAKYAGCGQNESQTVTGYASKPASHVVPRVRKPAGERLRGEGRMVGGRCSLFTSSCLWKIPRMLLSISRVPLQHPPRLLSPTDRHASRSLHRPVPRFFNFFNSAEPYRCTILSLALTAALRRGDYITGPLTLIPPALRRRAVPHQSTSHAVNVLQSIAQCPTHVK